MTLTKIIEAAAERMKDVTVDIDRGMGTVSITSDGKDDIFMQGDDADQFIAEVDKVYREVYRVTEDNVALWHAEQYCENLWS